MRTISALLAALFLAGPAAAHEYVLQFTPNPGARGLVVAGYAFHGRTVEGNCSYRIVTSGSGRGGGYHSHTTYFDQTCRWDLYGNLLSTVPGAPVAPAPLSSAGGLTVYARSALGATTGIDARNGTAGFVDSRSAQYNWTTQPTYVFLPNQKPTEVTLTVRSDGDYPLVVTGIDPLALLARVSVKSTTCTAAPVKPGASCVIVVTYDPRGLAAGDNPYTAYDRLTVGLVSNAGQAPDFSQVIEVPVAPGG